MKLTRTVAYALQATLQIANLHPGNPVPCSRLAAEGQMPERFLLQVLRCLVNHGILRSTRGVDGGYSLQKPPEDVTLLEIIEAVEGRAQMENFPEAEQPSDAQLPLQRALAQITAITREQLNAINLQQLISPPIQDATHGG